MKKKLLVFLLGGFLLISGFVRSNCTYENKKIEVVRDSIDSAYEELPASIRTFDYAIKYAKLYDIPENIAFGILHYETNYNGVGQINYNPAVASAHKAYGACQIKVGTANLVSDKKITKDDLLYNLDLNIQLAFKHLSGLKKTYGSWKLALGAYNTGKPVVNQYAKNIIRFKTDKILTWIPNKG